MSLRLGVIGLSPGNGHPFSFSAIVNGYDDAELAAAGWPVIHEYVRRRDPADFGIEDARVTHAWTQDPAVTAALCAACRIPHAVAEPGAMLGSVDALLLLRDDPGEHWPMARPFLEAGVPVLIDKPLTLDADELARFRPYLEAGRILSCSGMRYARELDEPRSEWASYGKPRLLRGTILNDFPRYGIHMLDALLSVTRAEPIEVVPLPAAHEAVAVRMDDGSMLQVDALGEAPRCFRIDLYGSHRVSVHEVTDNFSMFRRLLWRFLQLVRTREDRGDAAATLRSIGTLIAAMRALAEQRPSRIHDVL